MSHLATRSSLSSGLSKPRVLWKVCLVALLACFACAMSGCEKDATALSQDGKNALFSQQYDKAITSFDAALKLDSKNFDATLGLAEAYLEKKEYAKAEENFKKARDLNPGKGDLRYLNEKYQALLLGKAKEMSDKTSAEYEKALLGVLEIRKKTGAAVEAYGFLSDYYMERGNALAKDKKTRAQAVEMFLKMKTIRTQATLRKEALAKVKTLRREIYDDEFAANFAKIKPTLKAPEPTEDKEKSLKYATWDEANKRIHFVILNENKDIKFKKDEEKVVRSQLLGQLLRKEAILMQYKLVGVEIPNELTNFNFKTIKVEKQILEKGKEEVSVSVELKDYQEIGYKRVVVPARKAKEKGAAGGKKDAAKKDAMKKDAAKKDAPKKDAPKKDAVKKEEPKK